MQSCLGIYIDNSMIKYAKVNKNGDDIKIEASGIRFFDDIREALEQIVQETNSYKIPISINLKNESYNYVKVFSVLNKVDIAKTIETEFANFCNENGLDSYSYENKYILRESLSDPDMETAMNVWIQKEDLDNQTEYFDYYKLDAVLPEPIVISNLVKIDKESNSMIVNIEDSTTVTLILDGKVNRIFQIENGMGEILSAIGDRENSLSKAYEVCKNITISSQDTGMADENEYLDEVMPVIDRIIEKVVNIKNGIREEIDNIYVTGTGIAINNIDLYFQNFFEDARCDMLRPEFLENKSMVLPVKEYMEVNSAIALALEEMNMQYYDVNFKPDPADVKKRIKAKKEASGVEVKSILDSKEKLLVRILATVVIFILGYGIFATGIDKGLNKSIADTEKESESLKESTYEAGKDISAIESLTETYKSKYNKGSVDDNDISKDALPNFLQQVMFSIPTDVVIDSIESVSDSKVSITVKSSASDKIDAFKAKLSSEEILDNIAVQSEKTVGSDMYKIITGDLPR